MRYYIVNSAYFDSHRYDRRQIANAVKQGGGTNLRSAHRYGWANQPKVVTFSAASFRLKAIEKSVQKAVGTQWIIIRKKDW